MSVHPSSVRRKGVGCPFFVNFFALQAPRPPRAEGCESNWSRLRVQVHGVISHPSIRGEEGGYERIDRSVRRQSRHGADARNAGKGPFRHERPVPVDGPIEIMQPMHVFHPLSLAEGAGKTAQRVGGLTFALSLAACSPALDWRESLIEGPGLTAVFPCRPIGQWRDVALAGTVVQMRLQACETAGSTFAVGVVDVGDPARIAGVMAALRESTLGKMPASSPAAMVTTEWSVAGSTPQAAAGRWQSRGERLDRSALSLDTAVFSRGTWVIQATLITGKPSPDMSESFFGGLHFGP